MSGNTIIFSADGALNATAEVYSSADVTGVAVSLCRDGYSRSDPWMILGDYILERILDPRDVGYGCDHGHGV